MTDIVISEARRRVIAARTMLLFDEPFFGTLALRLTLVEDTKFPTAWTDGESLGFNPDIVMKLTHAQLKGLIEHEVMHCAAGHCWRRANRDPEAWNEACDRSINPVLRDAGVTLPDRALYELEPSHKGKSAEWIYDRVPREPKDPSNGGGTGPGRPQAGGQQLGSTSAPNPLGEVRDAPPPTEGQQAPPTESEWQQAVQQAAALANGQGALPGDLKRFAKTNTVPRVDWRSALRRFAQEVTRADYTWARLNSRYIAQGVMLPALRSHEVGVIAIGVDTSGSIDQVLLNQFASEVQAIMDEIRPRQIQVMYCDARIHKDEVFERDEPILMSPCGGGGTDFRPVFDTVAKWEEPPVCIIYLTDLAGTFPQHEPGIPTLWVTGNDNPRTVPFGELVTTG